MTSDDAVGDSVYGELLHDLSAASLAAFEPTAAQKALLSSIYRCVTKETDHGPVTTWVDWGYICDVMDKQDLDADQIVRDLPSVPYGLFGGYGLTWRSEAGTVDIASTETVGLTMAGLRHVDMDAADRLARMLADLAGTEKQLVRTPHEPTMQREPLNAIVERYISPALVEPKAGVTTMTATAFAEMLRREPFLLVLPTGDEVNYEIEFGERRLRHLRPITDSAEYLKATFVALGQDRPKTYLRIAPPEAQVTARLAVTFDPEALHPWVWQAAASRWASGHFGDAVHAASRRINAELQTKVGRRDLSETTLFQQAFSLDRPESGKSRLRRAPDDGSQTYRNLHVGAMQLAGGLYMGVRNPIAHEANDELFEQEALELLAAFSVLARWVAQAEVVDDEREASTEGGE